MAAVTVGDSAALISEVSEKTSNRPMVLVCGLF
jgi:hypothetical protein